MFKIRNLIKSRTNLLLLSIVFCMINTFNVFAAGEPQNGNYKIKCVGTGDYINISNGQIVLNSSGNTVFSIKDTESASSIKWFSISNGNNALSFSNKDSNASLTNLIPGEVDRYDSNYEQYIRQRFEFIKSRSGYNIQPIAFGNNTDNRVLTVENKTLCLKKANGSRNQLFVLEYN